METEFDINTTEGAKAYLEKEGFNVDEIVKDGFNFIEIVKSKVEFKKRWIDADKEDPKDYQEVLVLLKNGEIFKATYCDDVEPLPQYTSEYFKFNKGVEITHWMPYELPYKF